ncbi:Glycoside hydrolase 18 protein [Pseudocyphellaria aurata]|nr:Glycoside hydrolase 18 protein [Pseudocyphellaria aurata]
MAAAAVTTFSSVASALDASGSTNMAVYWGQGPAEERLSHYCEDSSIDIIPLAFLNVFPDQLNGGYPGTNFGNQCGAETYTNLDGSASPLLSNCPNIGPDIKTCQAGGKKILLSLGGGVPTTQSIKDDASAVKFAQFLWDAFGPVRDSYHGPRPFGDAVVDGFDFDIENVLTPGEDPADLSRGYGTLIKTLRAFYALETPKQYYISGAPQCVVPDAHLAPAIETSWFDFLFVQFYNTPQCSARAFFDHTYGAYGGPPTDISFDAWSKFVASSSFNPNVKLYLGLPAAPTATYDPVMYLTPDEAKTIIEHFQAQHPNVFGGVMLFDVTRSETNSIGGKPYAGVLKSLLLDSVQAHSSQTQSTTGSLRTTTPAHSTTEASSSTTQAHSTTEASSSTTQVQTTTGASSSATQAHSTTGALSSSSPVRSSTGGASSSTEPPQSLTTYLPANSTSRPSASTYSGRISSAEAFEGHTNSSSATPLKPYSSGTGSTPSSTEAAPYPYSSGTGHRPYPTETGPVPYSSEAAPYPYASGTGHRPNSTEVGPIPYSSEAAPYSYSSGAAPRPYSTASRSPLGSRGTAPVPYSSSARPRLYSGTAPHSYSSASASIPYLTASGPAPYSTEAAPHPYSSGRGLHPYSSNGSHPHSAATGTAPAPYSYETAPHPHPSGSGGPILYSSKTAPYVYSSSTKPVPHYSSGPVPYESSKTVPHGSTGSHPLPYVSSSLAPYASSRPVPSGSSRIVPHVSTGPAPYASSTLILVSHVSTGPVHYTPSQLVPYASSRPVSHTILTLSATESAYVPANSTAEIPSYRGTLTQVYKSASSSSPEVHIPATSSSSGSYKSVTSSISQNYISGTNGLSSVESLAASSQLPTTQDVVATVLTSSYVTTYPITKTLTLSGSRAIQTTLSVSTVYVTYTSTICTKCVAPSTPAPVKPSATSTPVATTDVITTVIVHTSYTTCPVTKTVTHGTKEIVQVTQTVSTIYETVTSTICTKCTASPTPSPTPASVKPSATSLPTTTTDVVTSVFVRTIYSTIPVTKTVTYGTKEAVQVSQTISTIYETVTSTICTKCVAPQTPAPIISTPAATTQEVVITEIVRTTFTTCPVTRTVTSGTKETVQVSQIVSTIYETETSTICTKCVAPPTPAPSSPAPPVTTREVVTTVIVSTIVTTCPVTKTISNGNSPSIHVTQSVSTIYETITSTICTKCVAPPTITPGAPPKTSLVASTLPVVVEAGSSAPAPSNTLAETVIPSLAPVSPVVYSTSTPAGLPYVPDTTSVATVIHRSTATSVAGIVTLTLLPVPKNTPGAASPVYSSVPSSVPGSPSSVPVGNVPYLVPGNSTAPGFTGTAVGTAGTIGATPEAFRGAGNKLSMGFMSTVILAALIAALFV